MRLFGLPVYEHPALPKDEAWVILDASTEELPAELRGALVTPCIVAGDVAQLNQAAARLGLLGMWQLVLDARPRQSSQCRLARTRLRQQRRRHAHQPQGA